MSSFAEEIQAKDTKKQRYKTLLAFGKFFSFIGWIVVVLGCILFIMGLVQLGERNAFSGSSPVGLVGLLSGLFVVVYGVILVASGQGISCFVSIENNTHATMLTQQMILKMMSKINSQGPATIVPGADQKNLHPVKETNGQAEAGVAVANIENEEAEDLEFCYHCGAKLAEKRKNCPECGKKL